MNVFGRSIVIMMSEVMSRSGDALVIPDLMCTHFIVDI